ncbi:MAG: hypothetical protein BroJett011_04460 [Chloroflexota bacterium]|nr:MAG: hypothetical protein BroJett011_04460 [Chloroflexota bacterium]
MTTNPYLGKNPLNQVVLTPADLRLLIAAAQRALTWNEEVYLSVYTLNDPKFLLCPRAAYDEEVARYARERPQEARP